MFLSQQIKYTGYWRVMITLVTGHGFNHKSQIHIDILIGLNRIHSIGRDTSIEQGNIIGIQSLPFPLPIVLNTPIGKRSFHEEVSKPTSADKGP